jgi:pseudouridine kinase
MLAYTKACGVDVSACLESANDPTSAYLAVLAADGRRNMALEDMSILEEITAAFLRTKKDLIAQSSLVFIDANLSEKAMKAVLSLSGWSHVPVCADATSVLLAQRLLPHLGSFMMVTANAAEASVLCRFEPVVTDQETALQAARNLISQGVKLAIISLAEFGVVYATSETNGHVPAVRTQVVDPIGAGDALTATVLFGLLNHIPIDETVRLGVTAASLILRHRGTVFPYLTLEKLYDEQLV